MQLSSVDWPSRNLRNQLGSAWKSCGVLPVLRTRQKNGETWESSVCGGRFSDATIRAHYARGVGSGFSVPPPVTADETDWRGNLFASCGRKAAGGTLFSLSGLGEGGRELSRDPHGDTPSPGLPALFRCHFHLVRFRSHFPSIARFSL